MKIKIVGMNFQKPQHPAVEDDIVSFVHEADNPVDPQAIKVLNSHNEHIGYVATKKTVSNGNRKNGCLDNTQILPLLADGLSGRVTLVRSNFGFAELL